MTSIQSVLAAFAIILLDLLVRAGLDKVLAFSGGPTLVGLWAQLQSVVELVSSVAIAGVIQGLTVMIAQAGGPRDERSVLRAALTLGLGTSSAVALIVVMSAPALAAWLTSGKIGSALYWYAAVAGCATVVPATMNAYWLGKHQQQRMFRLALLTGVVLLMVAAGAWYGLALQGLVLIQIVVLVLIGMPIWWSLRKLSRPSEASELDAIYFTRLARFVPVGLAIGLLSPASMLLMRGLLSGALSWDDVGILQALWRSTEWVTATAAGVLSLIYLPRFSVTYGSVRFGTELARAALMVLIPAAIMLLLIFFNQRAMLSVLYDARFAVSDQTAALFLLGCWMRIAAWLFLYGLFAAHRTWLIVAGEVLSLPLFALLLRLFADRMTLERAALLYLVSYVTYLGFNAIALMYASHNIEAAAPGASGQVDN